MPTEVLKTNRRQWICRSTALAGLGVAGATLAAAEDNPFGADESHGFTFCLNTSTIRGQKLSPPEEIDVAAKAGYTGLEPWMRNLHTYVEEGGSVSDLRKRLEDRGLVIESAIGFPAWIVNDPEKRRQGLEMARRDMDLLAQLGAKRIAAPPAGVGRDEIIDPLDAAARYRELLEIGQQLGVTPQIEMWGGNRAIGRVGTAMFIAIESGHPDACFLGDVFHTYRGGSDFAGLKLLSPQALQVFHMNDYPADPPQNRIQDKDRVYPGDGIAPLGDILRGFATVGARPVLSLELFNPNYWQRNALEVAQTGLRKMQEQVAKAFA